MHRSRQQWLVAEWLGPSVTVRVRARAREFFFFVLKYHGVKMTYLASRNITTWKLQYNDLVS